MAGWLLRMGSKITQSLSSDNANLLSKLLKCTREGLHGTYTKGVRRNVTIRKLLFRLGGSFCVRY